MDPSVSGQFNAGLHNRDRIGAVARRPGGVHGYLLRGGEEGRVAAHIPQGPFVTLLLDDRLLEEVGGGVRGGR